MNKKFSTFFATIALLFGVMFASNAQRTDVIYLNNSDKGYLYQIAVGTGAGNQVLALNNDGVIVTVDGTSMATIENAGLKLANTLWCVETAEDSDQGANVVYSFLNKATGQYLSVTMDDFGGNGTPAANSNYKFNTVLGDGQTIAGGEIYKWKFSDSYGNSRLELGQPLYAFYNQSYNIGIRIDLDTNDNVEKVYFVKQSSKANIASDNTPGTINGQEIYTNFTLQTTNLVQYLSESQFNEVLGSQDKEEGVELVFSPEIANNPFLSNGKLFATDIDGTHTSSYLYIHNDNKQFLMVDTAYANTIGTDYLAYKWVDLSEETDPVAYLNADPFKQQYQFKFTYNPSKNELYIQVRQASYKNQNAKNWLSWNGSANDVTYTSINDPYIRVQDFGAGKALTVAAQLATGIDAVQNVEVGFADFVGCNVSATKASIPTNLYVITDGKGQYLAMPIHQTNLNEYTNARNTPEWVTIERNMDPWTMPAFQWVVEKTQSATVLQPTSPINIKNREYGYTIASGYQLYNNKEGIKIEGIGLTVDNFEADPSNVKNDPFVGYRVFDKDSLLIAGYTFKYLSGAAAEDLYLGVGGLESDSVLYASGQKVVFELDTIPTKYLGYGTGVNTTREDTIYGYTPTSGDKVLSGWAKLQRRFYSLKVKGSKDRYIVLDDEGRYAVSSFTDWDNTNVSVDKTPVRFYLKANNSKDGEIYYGLVDYTTNYNGSSVYQTPAGGVDDNSLILKSILLESKRMSAFAITHDDTPLYRRFKNDPAEGVAARAIDTPDTMRFFEKYRKEYLQMESNPSFTVAGIDFLGINAQEKAEGGISFIVDSAWIGRGLGYIKPQYLISIDRNDQPAVDAIPCPEEFHGNAPDGTPYDQWTCPHATKGTPGFNRGRYLINFEFPGYGVKDDAENDYVWKKFYRAGFVEAVHMGDSLYILRDEFAGLPNNRIDTAAIKAAEAAWRKDEKKAASDYYYIVNLQGDVHKFVTWSMRYLDPNHTATDNSFLMESVSETITINDAIAPTMGAWLKMNNGCLVLSDREESEFNRETAGDDALIFNVEYVEGDELATDDEVIAENSVVVIAGQGTVTVKNAAGKKVAISNILGQTVANTVVTSDNATIAVPAGVVVVAVEGEAAVKAIVK